MYREKIGMPKKPLFGFPLFIKENYGERPSHLTHAQYFHELASKWRSMPEEQKNKYTNKDKLLAYKEEMKRWISGLSSFRKDIYGLLRANSVPEVNPNQLSHTAWIPVHYIDLYKSLPVRPCVSPNGLYVREFFAKGNKDTLSNVVNMYSSLSDMEKEVFGIFLMVPRHMH